MSLNQRIVLLVLLAVFLPTAGTGSYVYFTQKHHMEASLNQQLREAGRATAALLDSFLVQRSREISMVGTSSTLRSTPERAAYGLGRYRSTFNRFDALFFVSDQGRLIAQDGSPILTRGDRDLADMVGRWLAAARKGRKILDVLAEPGEFERYLVFIAPVVHEGVHYGWVFGQVNLESIVAISNAVRIGETGRATLFNRDGILIGHPDKRRYGYDMSRYPIMREPVFENRGHPGGFFVSGDGREKWGMTLLLQEAWETYGLKWGLIVDQARQELYAPVTQLRNAVLTGVIAATLLILLAAFSAWRTLGIQRRVAAATRALRETEQRFEQFANNSDTIFWVRDGRHMLYVSPAFRRIWCTHKPDATRQALFGDIGEDFREEWCGSCEKCRENEGACLLQGLHPDDRERVMAGFHDAMASNAAFVATWRMLEPGGGIRWMSVREFPVQGNDSQRSHRTGTAEDITRRQIVENQLVEAMVVFNASSQAIVLTDAAGCITSVNPAFGAITGYGREEVLGKKPSLLKSGRHDAAFYQDMWASLAGTGRWEGEVWNRRKSGEIYPEWLSITAVADADGKVSEYIGLFSDISARKQQEAMIWHQANYDALTGLANRNLLHDRIDRAMAQARRNDKRVGVILLDLDGFKWINDTLGHDVGDQLLVEAARRLQGCVREQDTVARFGGDEFVLVIHGLESANELVPIAEKLVAELHEPFILAGSLRQISCSAGIAVFPDDGADVHAMLKNADVAMYSAKRAGKNRFQFFAGHMQADAHARMQIESDLHLALHEQIFTLHYQPIIDLTSGAVVGAEALIRWPHAERGWISPLDFIPVAEDSGLIIAIGDWVLQEAAAQWRRWQEAGLGPLRLAVNVSGVQFREASLPEVVARALGENGVGEGCLILEITESVLMEGNEATRSRLLEIRRQGVGYALDDFGTGYSSLSYLKRFPVDIVKIDRSFVRDCPEDCSDARLVEAIIHMAHSLDLKVTAEGVETEAQLAFLRELGCDYAQGFLIGKPMPAAEFEQLLRRHEQRHPEPS